MQSRESGYGRGDAQGAHKARIGFKEHRGGTRDLPGVVILPASRGAPAEGSADAELAQQRAGVERRAALGGSQDRAARAASPAR